MIRADMHIHSNVSDGSCTMQEIVAMAEERGLDGIVFTEHDTLSHTAKLPQSNKVKVAAGLEISAFDYEKNLRVHVLGYSIKDTEKVERLVHPTLEARHENSLKQIEILNQNGFEIDVEQVPKADGKYIYKQHIMDYLVSHGQAEELFGEFYYTVFKNGGICHFDIEYVNPLDAVRIIKDAGGYAVLAHSGQQQNYALIPALVDVGLDGLELHHHANSGRHKEIIRQYAKTYQLFLTGGSDFHGRYEAGSPAVGDYLSEQSGAGRIFMDSCSN